MKLARPPSILFAVVLVSCVENTGVIPITGRVPSEPSPMEEPQEAPDEMAPAGDYSQPGPWWASTVKMAFTGRGGNELITHIWYPTTDEGESTVVYSWPASTYSGEAFPERVPDCSEPRPIMIHSHGNSSLNFEMFYLQEFLATHGWLVAAPDHTGNTAYDDSAYFGDLLERRPRDIQDTFDWLVEQGNDPSSGLYGCVDEQEGYISSGYSFGGYTAYVNGGALVNQWWTPTFDYSDPRVAGIITFAPWNAFGYLTSGTSEVEVPVLTIGGESDWTVGTQFSDLYSHVPSTPRAMASFPLAGHFSFTPIYCIAWGNGCGDGFVAEDVFTSFVNTSVLAFSEHVRGRPGAIEQLPAEDDNFSWSYTK